jgi:hypothetical protein
MTILKPSSGPSDGEYVVRRTLNFLSRDYDASDPLGGADVTQFSDAIPIFRIDLDKIHSENIMSDAREVGSRYLIGRADTEQAVAIADVRKDTETGTTAFGRLARGGVAQRLWDATMLASETYGRGSEQFEFRIIDIPALQCSALWLHGDRGHDAFFPINSGDKADESKIREEPSFVAKVIGAASNYKRAAQAIAY